MDGLFFNAVGPVPLFRLNIKAVTKSSALSEITGEKLSARETAIPGKPVKKTAKKNGWSPGANR